MTSVAVSPVAGKSVLFLINQDLGGGVEYLARVIGDDLVSRGAHCETRVIYPSSACSAFQKLRHVASHAAMIAKSAPDVLITFQPTASAIASVAGRIGGCRVRIVHQSNSPQKSQFAVRELDKVLGSVGAYTVTIANSRATISEFEHYPASYRKRMTLIEHGIPPPVYALDKAAIRTKFRLPAGAAVLLMAARLDQQKGHHIIVRALTDLPDVHLAMAGSGPEHGNLLALAKRLGVADRVHFLGHVERQDLTDLYRSATLMVFPSTWETFGLAAVEAAMAGLPVVASDIPALHEVLAVNDETTAHFVASRNAGDWARVIGSCLSDSGLRPRSENFARAIQDKYSERRMIDGYVALYAELFP